MAREAAPLMTAEAPSRGAVAFFLLKFALISAVLLGLWWWIAQPAYVWVAGQAAGVLIQYAMGVALEGMRVNVDERGVLSTMTSLVYLYKGDTAQINVAFLVANLPAYIALVLATGGIGRSRRLRALAYGCGILFAGHVLFLVVMFTFARRIEEAPEVPTAFGIFVMTLPFLLWIVFAYWERISTWFDTAAGDSGDEKNAAPRG